MFWQSFSIAFLANFLGAVFASVVISQRKQIAASIAAILTYVSDFLTRIAEWLKKGGVYRCLVLSAQLQSIKLLFVKKSKFNASLI